MDPHTRLRRQLQDLEGIMEEEAANATPRAAGAVAASPSVAGGDGGGGLWVEEELEAQRSVTSGSDRTFSDLSEAPPPPRAGVKRGRDGS